MNSIRPKRSALLADLALAATVAFVVASLCFALAWIVPFELVSPRPR